MKVYFYPPPYPSSRPVSFNPYSDRFRESLDKKHKVVNWNGARSAVLDLIKHLFSFKVVIFNWIENLSNKPFKSLQLLLFVISFIIIKARRARVIWIMHNIHPHEGNNWVSQIIQKMMYSYADLIITHSSEAEKVAGLASCKKVVFLHHPVNYSPIEIRSNEKKEFDVLIWGAIEPYKGILEFVQYLIARNISWNVKIVGKCKNEKYKELLKNEIGSISTISYEDRRIPTAELNSLVKRSSYVVFPYLSSSVSSSGALMDTLMLGGTVIGPKKGAFKDLSLKGLCLTFDAYDEIVTIIESKRDIEFEIINQFLKENDWAVFVDNIFLHFDEI